MKPHTSAEIMKFSADIIKQINAWASNRGELIMIASFIPQIAVGIQIVEGDSHE